MNIKIKSDKCLGELNPKVGVRLINGCGLYTGFHGTFVGKPLISNQKCIDKIECLQERVLRVIEYEPVAINRKEISDLKISMGIEDLVIGRKRSVLRLMYYQSKKSTNVQIKEMNISLRSSRKINLKSDFTRLTEIQRSPYYRGLKLWNALPESIQCEQNRAQFKARVNCYSNEGY